MFFECSNCKEKVSYSKMVGLVFGQITAATLESNGVKTQNVLKTRFDSGEFTSGFLSGLKIKCPECGKSNWK